MGKASVNFRHEWVGRLLAVHYGCRISILIILKQTSSEGPSGTNGSSFYYSSLAGVEDVIRELGQRGISVWGGIADPSPGQSSRGHRGCKTREGQGGKSRTADKDMMSCTHSRSFCRSSAHQNIHASAQLFESPSPCPKSPFFPIDGYKLFGTLLKENAAFLPF